MQTAVCKCDPATKEALKYNYRIQPPKAISTERVVASRSVYSWQLLSKEHPNLLKDAEIVWDPLCGAGGLEQFMSYLATTKDSRKQLVS